MRENKKFCLLELSSLHVKFNLLPGPYGSLDTKEESFSSSRLLTCPKITSTKSRIITVILFTIKFVLIASPCYIASPMGVIFATSATSTTSSTTSSGITTTGSICSGFKASCNISSGLMFCGWTTVVVSLGALTST